MLALLLATGCRHHAPTPAGHVFPSFDRVLLLEQTGETWVGVSAGDLNGDGLPDIVLGKGRLRSANGRAHLQMGRKAPRNARFLAGERRSEGEAATTELPFAPDHHNLLNPPSSVRRNTRHSQA